MYCRYTYCTQLYSICQQHIPFRLLTHAVQLFEGFKPLKKNQTKKVNQSINQLIKQNKNIIFGLI